MQKLTKNYQNYVELLTENDYILALPTNTILQNCTIDEIFILEHIMINSFDGKELQSLNGKSYEVKDKKLVQSQNKQIEVQIISRDVYYANNGASKHFGRIIISNSLDQRFFDKNYHQQSLIEDNQDLGQMSAKKVMRDPFELVQFFKQRVFFEMEENYEDFLEEIRILKENHILMKGHEHNQSKYFKRIAENLKKNLLKTDSVQEEFGRANDKDKDMAIDNFVETQYFMDQLMIDSLIYERIGSYLRRNLINMYQDEERKFNEKVKNIHRIYKGNLKRFNEIFESNFKTDITPKKSLQIFKVFFRCQIPYEMFFTLNETLMMATEEYAHLIGKSKSTIDAFALKNYLVLIIIHARDQLEKEEKQFNFLSRMLLMEHFAVNVFGFGEEYYSFVSFRDAESMILQHGSSQ
ncbi:UNKNOWN [Stylonychia lemnae]|uniref:Uncharacterized protein n=1 Tax=Stylonychia lemnae TaxID=5949 RepID=A0A078BAX1_STYLE|nr:UNKNOWN [Stylonychia lemnae]|eukprot:CDW91715.1 UNKNOWN [Stylonychia lemnae]